MTDLTGSKVLIGERILCIAVKDVYFTSNMKFEKLNNYSGLKKNNLIISIFAASNVS